MMILILQHYEYYYRNAKNDGGWTPLHLGALNGHLDVARALIEKEADVNAKEDSGYTPLHWSA